MPSSSNCEYKFTILINALKNNPEAFKAYDKSIQLKDDNAFVLNNYAYYLSLSGSELEKAEKMSKKAVTIDPQNSSFQDTYGWVLFKQGKYKDAGEWILKALQNKENSSSEVLEHYGDVLYKLGDATQEQNSLKRRSLIKNFINN